MRQSTAGKKVYALRVVIAVLSVVAVVLWAPGARAQAVVEGFNLSQISFNAGHSGNVPCTEYGHASFNVRQVPGQTQFVQVVARLGASTTPAWLVRNIPAVASVTSTGTSVNLSQLGVSRGSCIDGSPLAYQVSVTNDPISSAPSLTSPLNTVVRARTDNAQGDIGPGGFAGASLAPALLPTTLSFVPGPISFVDRQGMGNIEQGTNECGPGAVVNSMHWLQSMGAINLGTETTAQSLEKMKSDMKPGGWTATGVGQAETIQGKLRYSQRAEHPLDIVVHYQADSTLTDAGESVTVGNGTALRSGNGGPPTFEFLMQELKNGQDVEISLDWLDAAGNKTGGHVQAITGALQWGNLRGVWLSDDTAQGAAGGLRTNHWAPIVAEGTRMGFGGIGRNRIKAIYAESPIAHLFLAFIADRDACVLQAYKIDPLVTGNGAFEPLFRSGAAVPGGFTPVPGSPFPVNGIFTQSVAVAGWKFVYAVNFGSNDMSGYSIDQSTGSLTPIFSQTQTGVGPVSVVAHPSGRFLYVANSGSSNISSYILNPVSGAAISVPGSTATGSSPRQVVISPSGQWLYVPNANSNNISVYAINQTTGALTPVAGSPFATGTTPSSVVIDPTGRFAYVTNQGSGNVSAYSVNGGTGALTPITGSPFTAGGGPISSAIDANGTYLYVANTTSNNVSGFRVDSTTGALTTVTGSPFAAGTGPVSVSMDPRGNFVYVANNGSNNTSAYSIAAATGVLTPVSGSPFAAVGGPISIATATIPFKPTTRTNPRPTVTRVGPSVVREGGPATTLSVFGTGFVPGSIVRWDTFARPTVFVSDTQLNVAIPASDTSFAGNHTVTVSSPTPGGGNSAVGLLVTVAAASATVPTLPFAGTVNGAGFQAGLPVAAGSIASSFGTAMASQTAQAAATPLPTSLAGSSLVINGAAAPLFFTASGQVNFQVPWEVALEEHATAVLTTANGNAIPVTIALTPAAPGIFSTNSSGSGQGAILIANTATVAAPAGSIPGATTRPVTRGTEFISIFATGLGPVSNRPATGAVASASPLSETTTRPTVTIGGVEANVVFSGLAPGFVALYQVNAQVPANAPTGNAVEVVLNVGRFASNKVTIAVQ